MGARKMSKHGFLVGLAMASLLVTPGAATAQGFGIEIGPGGVRVAPQGVAPPRSRAPIVEYCDDISTQRATTLARRQGLIEIERVRVRTETIDVTGYDRRDDRLTVIVDRCAGDVVEIVRLR